MTHAPVLKNGRAHAYACSCCNTRQERRDELRSAKRRERRNWRREEGLRG